LSKIDRFDQHLPIKTSPRLAEREFSLEPNPRKNKKPGNERRANPSLFRGPLSCALERMNSKLGLLLPGVRNQSHLL
jgi:hypothetical protein